MLVFNRAIIKKYWPAESKSDEEEIIRQVIIQIEAEVDNSRQVSELFNNMVRGLNRITLLDRVSDNEYILPAASIKPFNIKQKKIKIGKGEDADIVKSEFASLTVVTRVDEDTAGQVLSDLYSFFNIELEMTVDEFSTRVNAEIADETSTENE